jgi:hypothetical protein
MTKTKNGKCLKCGQMKKNLCKTGENHIADIGKKVLKPKEHNENNLVKSYNKPKELRKWLDEDKTICKADRDYICDFINENYISRDKVEGLKMTKIPELWEQGCDWNEAVDEINQNINNLLNK